MSFSKQVVRGVQSTMVARVVDIVANAVLMVIRARFLLTPEEYGLLYVAISVVGIAGLFGTLGLPSSTARYVTEYGEAKGGQIPHILRKTAIYMIALGLVVTITLILTREWVANIVSEPGLEPLLVAGALYVLFQSFHKYLTSVFQGFNQISLSALLNAVSAVGRLIFAVILATIGFGAVGALLGYAIGFVLATVVGVWYIIRDFVPKYTPDEQMESGLTRRILEYSVPLTATRSATVLDKKVDTILVGAIAGAASASYYTIAKQVTDACIAPASSLGYTISPAFGEDKVGDRLEKAAELYEKSLEHVLVLYIPGAVGLFLVAEPMVLQVFGPAYEGAVPVVQIISAFVFANAVTRITSDGLDFLGRARERAIIKMTTAVANFFLNLLLIPQYGAVGAALATVVTHSIYAGTNVYIISRELPITFASIARTGVGIVVVSAGMAIVVLQLVPFVSGVISLLGVVMAGIICWAILSTVSGLFDVRQLVVFLQ